LSNLEIAKGYGNISFEKEIAYAKIRSPLKNFELVEQKIEYRRDPLTKHRSRVNKLRAERVKQATSPGENFEINLKEVVAKSAKKCFFCSENLTKSTPKFQEDLKLGDRITIGKFSLFPNLFVFSQFHAVGTLGEKHFTKINEFDVSIWRDALLGSIQYFKAVYDFNSKIKYPSINFNFLPPSASSIVHPHIQIIQDAQPTKQTKLYLKKSKEYSIATKDKSNTHSNYWLDLIESERKLKERFIRENDFMAWMASFSPQGKDELLGIIKKPKTDITTFTEEECNQFAQEIVQAMKALHFGRGATSVNMSIFLGPIGDEKSDSFRISLKLVSRPTLLPNYTGDIGFMELLHNEPIAAASPEDIALSVKEYFNDKNE
jgi:galactose-1-phosphate uridylyltransferase